jgi:multidrug efflux pump
VRVEVNPDAAGQLRADLANLQSVLSLQNADLAKGQITDGM